MRYCFALLAAACLAAPALAQTCTTEWAAPVSGAWENAANWTAGVPSGGTACITVTGTYTVTGNTTDKAIGGLVLGGESGTQTLQTESRITASGNVRVGPNGRWAFRNRIPGGTDGLALGGTLRLEGAVDLVGGVSFLGTGGTLDVAAGGVLRMSNGAGAGAPDGLFRVAGEVVGACADGRCQVDAPVEVDGGALRAETGRIDLRAGGTLRDATVDAAAGAQLFLVDSGDQRYLIEGTLTGAPEGDVLWSATELAASADGATLDVGGTGVQLIGSSFLTSAGGAFTNTGRIVRPAAVSNFSGLRAVEVINRGTVEVRTGLSMAEGAVLRNEPEGVVEFTSTGSIGGVGGSDGLVVSRGLVVVRPTASGTLNVGVPVDLADSEVRVEAARLDVRQGGAVRDMTFGVSEGAALWLGGVFDVAGTLSGAPQGDLFLVSGTTLRATADVTFDVGGAGLVATPGSGGAVFLTSAGGAFTNAGRLRAEGNGLWVRQAVLRNVGTFENRTTVRIEQGGVVRNEGTAELIQSGGASGDGTGRFVNAALVVVRPEAGQTGARSALRGTLRSEPGSELRVLAGAQADLDAPGSATLPAGARLTGDGTVFTTSADLFLEGTVSPGTDAEPFGVLNYGFWTFFSRVAGDPRLVIDVGAGGVSDRLNTARGPGAAGSVRLAGALVVRVADGYTPQPGDTFTVLRTTTTTGDIVGDFDVVLTEGGPTNMAFVAERNADNSEVIVRAVEAAGGAFTVSAEAVVGGGPRSLFLSGPGAPGVTAARLACTACLDADAFGTIPATVSGDGTVREVRADLTSPRAFGLYDLVLTRAGLPDTTVALTVRPFLSYISFNRGINRGVGVRPAGNRYNWSAFSVSNASNSPQPGYGLGAVNRDAPDKTAFAVAVSNQFTGAPVFFESDDAPDPEAAALVFARVEPGRAIPLSYGQRIAPENVLFPEQTRTGPDDDRVPFGEPLVFSGLVAHHLSFDRMRGYVLAALDEDAALADYLASVESADPGAVAREVERVLFIAPAYTEGLPGLLGRLLRRLDDVRPVPAGLGASAAPAFLEAMDAASGQHLLAIYEAHEVDVESAPAEVRQLLVDEFEALGGYGASAQGRRSAQINVSVPTCKIAQALGGAGGGGDDGVGQGATAPQIVNSTVQALRQVRQFQQRRALTTQIQAIGQAIQTQCKTSIKVLESTQTSGGEGNRVRVSGGCALPPPPPGGPSGGGGAACGPPSAPADPNDKMAFSSQFRCETGTVTVDGEEVTRCVRYFVPVAAAADPIVYTVDFENIPEATAPAEAVTITDELDPNLDPSTLKVLATSSDSTFSVAVSGQTATFRFVGIDLPPNVEAPEGQGFVTFAVRPRAGLAAGAEIRNAASIVFDFNPAIATPAVVHEVRETADLGTALAAPAVASGGGAVAATAIAVNGAGDVATDVILIVSAGVPITAAAPETGACAGVGTRTVTCEIGALAADEGVAVSLALDGTAPGVYAVTSSVTSDAFDAFNADDTDAVEIEVRAVAAEDPPADGLREVTLASPAPNPSRGPVVIRWGLPAAGRARLKVVDLLGREIATLVSDDAAEAGWRQTGWSPNLAAGVYVVRLDVETGGRTETRTRRLVVVR